MKILAIESSADETSVALVSQNDTGITVEKNLIASQIEMHREFGGIVPNLAGKFHAENIMPLLRDAAISKDDIDLIAVTAGPGLMPCLVVGVSAANALAFAWQKPLLGIHHIEGHIYANWILSDPVTKILGGSTSKATLPTFPALCLVVSGGHTQIMLMHDHLNYEIIGQTQDDAVGEAYDKAARLLGLPYPGGPEIDTRAHAFAASQTATVRDRASQLFTRPMLHSDNYNFSFSGLKTAVLYAVRDYQKNQLINKGKAVKSISKTDFESVKLPEGFVHEICFAFQEAAIDVLVQKTLKAADEYNVQSVLLAGGVSANKALRSTLKSKLQNLNSDISFHVPDLEYCLDNGAMIGAAAAYRWERLSEKQRSQRQNSFTPISANPNLKII